jgi:hypothetical protein
LASALQAGAGGDGIEALRAIDGAGHVISNRIWTKYRLEIFGFPVASGK